MIEKYPNYQPLLKTSFNKTASCAIDTNYITLRVEAAFQLKKNGFINNN